MSAVLGYLEHHRVRLGLEGLGVPARLSGVVLTPRFRASRHVIVMILPAGRSDPVLVAKIARLPGASASLNREAAALEAVHALRPGGFDSIPRVVALGEIGGHALLIETALSGRPLDPPAVRRDRAGSCAAALTWLSEVQRAGRSAARPDQFEHVALEPLRHFADAFPLTEGEARLWERTWALVEPLRAAALPAVVEHGDLSHPNLILRDAGGLGVVDWELADVNGLPGCDLFYFLAYAAFALADARARRDFLGPFRGAFFGAGAWARPYVEQYAAEIGLPASQLAPLFVLCWARTLSTLPVRLGDGSGPLQAETVAWLRANRYYALWRYAVEHVAELNLAA